MTARELVPLLRRGDRAAFERFYQATKAALLAYALSWSGGRRGEAEDLVQEAYLGFLRNLDRLRDDADPLPYLLSSVRNRARDRARAFAPRTTASAEELSPEVTVGASSPLDQLVGSEQRNAVIEALLRLPETQAEAVRAHLLLGCTWEQAGSALGCPAATVRTRYREAIQKLQRWLGRYVRERA